MDKHTVYSLNAKRCRDLIQMCDEYANLVPPALSRPATHCLPGLLLARRPFGGDLRGQQVAGPLLRQSKGLRIEA